MQQSGGLLPAAAGRSGTFIFANGKNANESPAGHIAIAITQRVLIFANGKNASESSLKAGFFGEMTDLCPVFLCKTLKVSLLIDLVTRL